MRRLVPLSTLLVIPLWALIGPGSCLHNDRQRLDHPNAEDAASQASQSPQRLAAGDEHTCLIGDNDRPTCWGSNVSRQLGHDRLPRANAPAPVPTITHAIEVAAGDSHTCIRDEDMKVRCWGGKFQAIRHVDSLRDARHIASGGDRACAVEHDGVVTCWDMSRNVLALERVSGLDDALEVAMGKRHACARTTRGELACWGSNRFGQLGDGRGRFRANASFVPDLTGVIDVAAGKSHTCAVRYDGAVFCWGWGRRGQLGVGRLTDEATPQHVQALASAAVEVTAGEDFSCARLADGRVQCWGSAKDGRLGNLQADEEAIFSEPSFVEGLTGAVAITAGRAHACAELDDSRIVCWGTNDEGQLGEGPQLIRPLPTPNTGISEATTKLAAGSAHACAVLESGRVACWGHNRTWQLGDRGAARCAEAMEVRDVEGAVDVTNGGKHSCALLKSGEIACWGTNGRGQMGDERREIRTRAKRVPGVKDAIAVDAGLNHTCAVRANRTVMCWGDNRFAQLGDGTRDLKRRPVRVKGMSDVIAVVAAAKHSCALQTEGQVWCWGRNDVGQIGDGTRRRRPKPRMVKGLGGPVVELAAYQNRTCARRNDGTVLCWGDHKPTAQAIAQWPMATQISMGVAHVCALEHSGKVSCVGQNYSGQLGDGSRIFRPEPFELNTLSNVSEIAAGKRFTCARLEDGGVTCWGDNHFGQLGYQGTPFATAPTAIAFE